MVLSIDKVLKSLPERGLSRVGKLTKEEAEKFEELFREVLEVELQGYGSGARRVIRSLRMSTNKRLRLNSETLIVSFRDRTVDVIGLNTLVIYGHAWRGSGRKLWWYILSATPLFIKRKGERIPALSIEIREYDTALYLSDKELERLGIPEGEEIYYLVRQTDLYKETLEYKED